MTVAFLFPGQGAKGLFEAAEFATLMPLGKEMLQRAAEATSLTVADILARGGRALERTEVQQPVVTAIGLFVHAELVAAGIEPDVVAGHSLGELPAWAATGAITPEDAITIAALRGRLMAREAVRHPGVMIAITASRKSGDLSEVFWRGTVQRAAARHGIKVAASNAPGEVVISGEEDAIREFLKALKNFLSVTDSEPFDVTRSTRRLPVAGAWHHESMKDAVPELEAALTQARRGAMRIPMVLNATGKLATEESLVPRLLAGQLVETVRWTGVMNTLAERGVTHYVTIAPGVVLRSLVRTNLGAEARVYTTEDAADIQRTVGALRWRVS